MREARETARNDPPGMNWGQAKYLLRLATSRRAILDARRAEGSDGVAAEIDRDAPSGAPSRAPNGGANGAANGTVGAEPEHDLDGRALVLPASDGHGAPKPLERVARSLCVASGKGGTGKSAVTASLATLFAREGSTLIVDADMGVGNAHILQGVSPEASLVDVAEGRLGVADVVQSCRDGVDLLCAGSGVSRMAGLSTYELHLIASGIDALESRYDRLVVDSAAGISEQTLAFAAASDRTLLVTTPDLTAITDAYAFLKVLYARDPQAKVELVVNRVESDEEGRRAAERIASVSERFLGRAPRWIGTLPDDPAVRAAGNHRSPVVLYDAEAPFTEALGRLAERLAELDDAEADELDADGARTGRVAGRGLGERLVAAGGFSRRFARA